MPTYELRKKYNETLEEGYKRKSKILDAIYEESMKASDNKETVDPLCVVLACIIEVANKLSIKED